MVAEAEIVGIGLEVVRAALDSERVKHAQENSSLRRAARKWKTRAQTLDERLCVMKRELRDLRAENKAAAQARQDAEAALQHVKSERDTLRGFKQRILASISSGAVSLSPPPVDELPSAAKDASPCGTVVGADRQRSLTTSDKIRNWEADDAVCAEEQELARKVQMMQGWDPGSSGGCSSSSTLGQSSVRRSLETTPLSPVASRGEKHGWDKLLDCSTVDAVDSTLSLGGSPSSSGDSVGDSGAATRHSTDASSSFASGARGTTAHRRFTPSPDSVHAPRAEDAVDGSVGLSAAYGLPADSLSLLRNGRSERAFRRVRSTTTPSDTSSSSGRQAASKSGRGGAESRSPVPVSDSLRQVLTELERKAEALQVAQDQQNADRRQYAEVQNENERLLTQLERAQQEIQQVRCVNEHLVASVNAVRVELRGTPGSVAGPVQTPATGAGAPVSAQPKRETGLDDGLGVGTFSPQVVAALRRFYVDQEASNSLVEQQPEQQHGEATTDWASETGSSLSIVATPPSAEVHATTRDDERMPHCDDNDLPASTALSTDESTVAANAERQARLELRQAQSQSYLSERDHSFLARAAALEIRRQTSPAALDSSSASSN